MTNILPPPPFPPLPPDLEHRKKRVRRISLITCGLIILAYAAFYRFAFTLDAFGRAGGVVSLSFIFSVPAACGALCVAIGRFYGSDNWVKWALWFPCVILAIGLLLCIVTKIEAIICVLMAAPILFAACVIGGLVAHFSIPRNRPPGKLYLNAIILLPMLSASAEGWFHWPSEVEAITNTIVIHAPAARIWPQIASVAPIDPRQLRESWIYRIGFPKPVSAELDRPGIGGIRTATFERNVSFFETVTEWQENQRLSFTIHADPDFIPHTAFDRHIIVGGRFYDVLDGTYEIEAIDANTCRLHLTSHHRLSTRFNSYAAWWSVKIMEQIQGTILEVIRTRAETGN